MGIIGTMEGNAEFCYSSDEDEDFFERIDDPLPKSFYKGDCRKKSKELLGKVLVTRSEEGISAGIIVETEAYLGERDPACHAHAGRTPRTEPFYKGPGKSL